MSSNTLVNIEGVWKGYGEQDVLRGIDLDVSEGQVVCLLGPSGGGKSTLLRCINHLEPVDRGLVTVDGEPMGYKWRSGNLHELRESEVCRQRKSIGMVFQQFNLFSHMTVIENLTLAPIKLFNKPRKEAIDTAMELLERVGLSDRAKAYPSQLSGGQSQRVGIARALAIEPRLMLFDEPTSALDPELVGEVLKVMESLVEKGMTMIVVTHEMEFANEAADKIAVMYDGEIVESGTPSEVLENPQNAKTQKFLSRVLK